MNKNKHLGFTIVELMVVIVVIGILASVTVVAYNGVHANARDASRRQGASNISKAIQLLFSNQNVRQVGGLYSTLPLNADGLCQDESSVLGNKGGWLYNSYTDDGYECDIGGMLVANDLVQPELMTSFEPNKEITIRDNDLHREDVLRIIASTMFFRCVGHDDTYVLYYYLEKPTQNETEEFERILSKCTASSGNHQPHITRDRYHMKAAIELHL